MTLSVENEISILPFEINYTWKDIFSVSKHNSLSIKIKKLYLFETDSGQAIFAEDVIIPLFIDSKFEKKKAFEIFELVDEFKKEAEEQNLRLQDVMPEIKLFKYAGHGEMPIKIRGERKINSLFKDFSFSFEKIKDASFYVKENCVIVDNFFKQFLLIDGFLVMESDK